MSRVALKDFMFSIGTFILIYPDNYVLGDLCQNGLKTAPNSSGMVPRGPQTLLGIVGSNHVFFRQNIIIIITTHRKSIAR